MSHIEPADIERVLEAAGRLFAEKGYDGVGMRQISEESGVKMSSIFYHFGSKSLLYEEVVENRYKAIVEMIRQAIKSLHDPELRMERILVTLFDALINDRISLLLLQRDVANAVANQKIPTDPKTDTGFISLGSTLLESAFDKPEERRIGFSLGSLIVGFCGMTAAMMKDNAGTQEGEWYAEQRDELIAVLVSFGKRARLR